MFNKQAQSSSSHSAQQFTGPIAQQVQKIQSSRQSSALKCTQQTPINPIRNKRKLAGFADKTLWDWLNLIAILLVPLMIGVFTIVTTIQQSQISQQQFIISFQLSKQQHESDQQIATDQQQAVTLKAYFDTMTDLILHSSLLQSKPDDVVRITARMTTLTTLQELNGELQELNGDRKGALIQFLYEAKLIRVSQFNRNSVSSHDPIISLVGANLSEANLSKAFLIVSNLNYGQLTRTAWSDPRGVVLSGIDLSGVDLSDVNLSRVSLSEANLEGAKATPEQLGWAYSLNNAILPDGSTYPSQSYPLPFGP